jgi:acyl carrier protein
VAANLFLDTYSHTTSGNGTAWISANWDPWPNESRRFQNVRTSVDQYAMTAEESLKALMKTIEHIPFGQVVVATGDLEKRLNIWSNQAAADEALNTTYARPHLEIEYVPPADDIEHALARIWQRLLGVEQIGRHDDFFDLGGHSLLATRLIAQLRDEFHCEVPINKFFEKPTISALAELIRTTGPESDQDNRAAILAVLAELSEDEVELEIKRRDAM